MATDLGEHDSQAGVSTLVSGIIQDARQLFVQQLTLFQVELKNDFRRTLEVCIPMICGVLVCFVAAITLDIGAGFLLSWVWEMQPWAGLLIAGFATLLLGIALIWWGKSKFDTFSLLPEKSVEGLKENLQWKTKS
jgi:hypothetical protein